MNIDEIFDFTSFTIDREPHIVLDNAVCVGCDNRGCTNSCPARCYTWSEADQKMTFVYDGCLECGTCRIICNDFKNVAWEYPRGGYGILFKFG